MPFGFLRTSAVIRSLSALPSEIAGLRRDVHSLQAKVQTMSTAQDQVTADIALIKSEVATMAANYTAAAAAAQTKALADAQAAWQANDDAAWTAAHAQLTDVITAMSAGQPITPPATAANPSPAPIAAPALDGSTSTPSAPSTVPAATPAPATIVATPAA